MKVKANFINLDVAQGESNRIVDSFEFETPDSIDDLRKQLTMLKAHLYFQDKFAEGAAAQLQQQIDSLNSLVTTGQIDKQEAGPQIAGLQLEVVRFESHDRLLLSQNHSENPPPRRILLSSIRDVTSDVAIWWRYYEVPVDVNLSNEAIAKAMQEYSDQLFENKFAQSERLDRAEQLWAQGERNMTTICEFIRPDYTFLSVAEKEDYARQVKRALTKRRSRVRRHRAKKP